MVGYVNVYWNKLAFKKSLLYAESRGNVHLLFIVMCYIRAGPLSGLSRITTRYHQILISPTWEKVLEGQKNPVVSKCEPKGWERVSKPPISCFNVREGWGRSKPPPPCIKTSDCQGFENLPGSGIRVWRVGVRVEICIPLKNKGLPRVYILKDFY